MGLLEMLTATLFLWLAFLASNAPKTSEDSADFFKGQLIAFKRGNLHDIWGANCFQFQTFFQERFGRLDHVTDHGKTRFLGVLLQLLVVSWFWSSVRALCCQWFRISVDADFAGWSQEQCPERGSWSVDHCWCCLCPSQENIKKNQTNTAKWGGKGFSPQTCVQDLETLSQVSRFGSSLQTTRREAEVPRHSSSPRREKVMLRVAATSLRAYEGTSLIGWPTKSSQTFVLSSTLQIISPITGFICLFQV